MTQETEGVEEGMIEEPKKEGFKLKLELKPPVKEGEVLLLEIQDKSIRGHLIAKFRRFVIIITKHNDEDIGSIQRVLVSCVKDRYAFGEVIQ